MPFKKFCKESRTSEGKFTHFHARSQSRALFVRQLKAVTCCYDVNKNTSVLFRRVSAVTVTSDSLDQSATESTAPSFQLHKKNLSKTVWWCACDKRVYGNFIFDFDPVSAWRRPWQPAPILRSPSWVSWQWFWSCHFGTQSFPRPCFDRNSEKVFFPGAGAL